MSPSDASRHAIARLFALTALACVLSVTVSTAREPLAIVQGVAWNSDNSPLAKALVRLLDTTTGRVVSAAESSNRGQFSFAAVRRGFYVVELVSEAGRVLAVGPSVRVEGGETVSTMVRLPSKRSWFDAMFSNTAAGVIAVASSVGLTALGPQSSPGSPASPAAVSTQARPISPQ
jgi:hypothetical protein